MNLPTLPATALLAFILLWVIAARHARADERGLDAAPFSEALEAIRQRHAVPALAAAAVREGSIVAIGACGVRKFGSPEPVALGDAWHLGSCTKSMTASLAAILVDDGKVKWTTTVAEVFPELREKMHPEWRDVTLELLLTHRSGAPGDAPPALWRTAFERHGTPTEQRLAFTRGLLAQKPEATPGTQFIYSNQGYAIAGAMLERVTGQPWEELLRARLFAPLGMETAGFGEPASVGKVDAPWGHLAKGASIDPVPPGPAADNPPAIGPAGTVHCSIRDFVRYAGWHARGGRAGRTLLSDEGFTRLHTPVGKEDYGMGWSVVPRGWAGGLALTHNGSNTMFYAVLWVAPEKDAAFVAATNLAGPAAEAACDDAVSTLVRRYLK